MNPSNEVTERAALIDTDGENRALRSFLLQYTCDRPTTVGAMLAHMNRSGWRGMAPAFALSVRPETHLTKGGAQVWIRHLLSLEATTTAAIPSTSAEARKLVAWVERDGDHWHVYDADSDTGQHISMYQKDTHYVSMFPLFDGPAPADSAAERNAARLLKAATTYAYNYCQDEADLEQMFPFVEGSDQRDEARELFAAIAAMQQRGT